MFHQIEDILEKKGQKRRGGTPIYDDVGCIGTLPPRYYKQLQKKGIKCAAFNPFRPLLSVIMNNRDHRKILWWTARSVLRAGSIWQMNISMR